MLPVEQAAADTMTPLAWGGTEKLTRPMVALGLLLALGSGCATTPSPGQQAAEAATWRGAECFRIASVNNWRVIDRRQLIVYGPRRDDAWHLTLFANCEGLDFTEVLAFRARGSTLICGDPGDEILFRDQRCSIAAVRAISPAEVEILRNPGLHDDIGKLPPSDKKQSGDGSQ